MDDALILNDNGKTNPLRLAKGCCAAEYLAISSCNIVMLCPAVLQDVITMAQSPHTTRFGVRVPSWCVREEELCFRSMEDDTGKISI